MPNNLGGARRGAGRPPTGRNVSGAKIYLSAAQRALAERLGGGNASAGVRLALDAAGAASRRVELWRHSSGARFAVLCERGRPILAAGPLTHAEAAGVIAGDTDFDWSSALADDINAEDEQGDEAAYRRVWPEGKEE